MTVEALVDVLSDLIGYFTAAKAYSDRHPSATLEEYLQYERSRIDELSREIGELKEGVKRY